jgi:hypothetical protein
MVLCTNILDVALFIEKKSKYEPDKVELIFTLIILVLEFKETASY